MHALLAARYQRLGPDWCGFEIVGIEPGHGFGKTKDQPGHGTVDRNGSGHGLAAPINLNMKFRWIAHRGSKSFLLECTSLCLTNETP